MTIRFHCPICAKLHEVPDTNAGQKGKCACGQKIQVPAPVNRTVLGRLAQGPPPPPLPAPSPSVELAPVDAPPPVRRQPTASCPRCGRLICCSGVPFETVQCAVCHTMFDSFSRDVIQQAPPPAIISPLAGVERYSPAHTSHVHRYEHAPAGAGGGFGVAAMVLGVVGLPLSFFFCVYGGLPGVICAVLAIVFGVIGMTGQSGRGLAVAGLVLGVVTAALRLLLHLEFLEIADALSRHR